jgi:hypothetical protein
MGTPICVEDKEHVLSYGHISPYMVYKCNLHMFYFNKKIVDIATSHVLLELFSMQLFFFMSTMKHQQNITAEPISTSPDRENNTTACRLVGVGDEHRKAPKKNNNNPKKKKTTPTTGARRQPCKAESKKIKQQAPIQRESTNMTNCSPKSPKRKPDPNKHNQQPTNQQTREQATTNEPVNNICISNDYETAVEAHKESETNNEHASGNKQTFLLANCKH